MDKIQRKNWLFRIDRVDVSVLGQSWKKWKAHSTSILYEVSALFESPLKRIHNGKSPNPLYRRLVKYANDSLQLEVFYQRTTVRPECYVLARLRFTVLQPDGYYIHTKFVHYVEQILRRYGVSHHICYAEVCLDTTDLQTWLSALTHCVVSRADWSDYGYCIKGEERHQGFDTARRNLYVFWKDSPAQVVCYRKSEFDLYRAELRLRRTRLRNHKINNIADLLEKGLDIFQSIAHLYEFQQDQSVPSAWLHHQNKALKGKRQADRILKRARRLEWGNIETDATPIINNKQSTTNIDREERRRLALQRLQKLLSQNPIVPKNKKENIENDPVDTCPSTPEEKISYPDISTPAPVFQSERHPAAKSRSP